MIPAADGISAPIIERHSDVTVLYHLKTQTKPFATAAFHEDIGVIPGPNEDWRWSIVEAKGIRPAGSPAPESLSQPLFGDPLTFVPSTNDPPWQTTLPRTVPAQTPAASTKQNTATDNSPATQRVQR